MAQILLGQTPHRHVVLVQTIVHHAAAHTGHHRAQTYPLCISKHLLVVACALHCKF